MEGGDPIAIVETGSDYRLYWGEKVACLGDGVDHFTVELGDEEFTLSPGTMAYILFLWDDVRSDTGTYVEAYFPQD